MRFKWALILLVVLLVPVFLEAGGAKEPKVTITFWSEPRLQNVPGMEDKTKNFGDYEKILAAEFMAKYPNVTVEVQSVDWGDLPTKIPAAIAAGTPPNVLKDYLGRSSKYAFQGVLEDMSKLVPQAELDDYFPDYIKMYTLNGQLHALPHVAWAQLLIVNRSIWKAAGKENLLPTAPAGQIPTWTTDQFETAIRAVAVPNKLWPVNIELRTDAQGDYGHLGYFWGFGAKLYKNQDYTKPTLNSPEGVGALQWLVKLQNDGLVIPGTSTISTTDADTLWYSKQSAVRGGGLPNWPALDQERKAKDSRVVEPFDMMLVAFPTPAGSPPPGVAVGPTGIIVFKQKDDNVRKWAVEFARFINSGQKMAEYAKFSAQFPTRKAAGTPITNDPNYAAVLAYMAKYGVSDMGIASPKYAAVRLALPPQLQAAILGEKTPQQALADYEKEALKILSQ